MNQDTSNMNLEIRLFVQLVLEWLWLIILLAILGGALGFFYHNTSAKFYQATATVLVGNFLESANPNSSEMQTSARLAETYAEIIKTQHLVESLIETFELDISTSTLWDRIDIDAVNDTSLLEIDVIHTDPQIAADLVNEIVTTLINRSNESASEQANQISLVDSQIIVINEELASTRSELDDLNLQLEEPFLTATLIQQLQSQRNDVRSLINQSLRTISELQSLRNELAHAINTFTIIQEAEAPSSPVNVNSATLIGLGALAGGLLAIGFGFLYEIFDDQIRSRDHITGILHLKILGQVPIFGQKNKPLSRLVTDSSVPVRVREIYRFIQAHLLPHDEAETRPVPRLFMLVSPHGGIGTTLTTINLGATMATSGLHVLIINANDDDSNLGQYFVDETEHVKERVVFDTTIPNLKVLRLADIKHLDESLKKVLNTILSRMRDEGAVDIVLIDTPATSDFADAAILAGAVDLEVIFVLELHKIHIRRVKEAQELFANLNRPVVGCIVNRSKAAQGKALTS